MARTENKIDVYLEVGKKWVVAGAVEWPGWVRWAKDEASALRLLCDYGPRYQRVVRSARLEFEPPMDPAAFRVVEKLEGNSITDFGAPARHVSADTRPVDAAELARLEAILKACWRAFDQAARTAEGRELAKGPRGGGRKLDAIARHVAGAEVMYSRNVGWQPEGDEADFATKDVRAARKVVLKTLRAAVRREYPESGPRGGRRWKPRYFVRRVAYHVLDHAWEIQDRAEGAEPR